MLSYDERAEAEVYIKLCADFKDVFSSPLPLKAALDKVALDFPNSVALTDGVQTLTYFQLSNRVLACVEALRQHAVGCGMRVVIRMPNSLEFYMWYHAVHALGAVAVLVPSLLHSKEVARIFTQCSPDFVISDAVDCAELLSGCGLPHVGVLNPFDEVRQTSLEFSWQDSVVRSCDDLAVILYSSGSTGEPRGIMLSSRNILTNALQSYTRMMAVDLYQERFLVALPLAHSFGHMTCLWLPLVSASAVFVVATVTRAALKEAFDIFKPTMFFGVPALYGALCMTRGLRLDSVRLFVSGGDFLPAALGNVFALLYGRYICPGYGLSEASPVVGLNIFPSDSCSESISPLLAGISYKVVPHQSEDASSGELWVKGENIMLGYFSSDGKMGEGLAADGWLPTGDMVCKKSDGSLVMTGRRKDIIIFKGFNIYPQELEVVLLSHPDVQQAMVFAQPHSSMGQIPVACVVGRAGKSVDERDLVEHCKAALASYKIPHKIVVLSEFPLNHLGKIDRRTVKKNLEC